MMISTKIESTMNEMRAQLFDLFLAPITPMVAVTTVRMPAHHDPAPVAGDTLYAATPTAKTMTPKVMDADRAEMAERFELAEVADELIIITNNLFWNFEANALVGMLTAQLLAFTHTSRLAAMKSVRGVSSVTTHTEAIYRMRQSPLFHEAAYINGKWSEVSCPPSLPANLSHRGRERHYHISE